VSLFSTSFLHQLILYTSCFPHVVNLCVKAGLKRLTAVPIPSEIVPQFSGSDKFINELENELETFEHLIVDDPVAAVRSLATALWATGQWREDLEEVILEAQYYIAKPP
jgi:hypothetical protein